MPDGIVRDICRELERRQRFLITSHARPDGDSIGSELAMAFALRAMGKHVDVINKDQAPSNLADFPGVGDIRLTDRAEGTYDAAVIMECSDLARTGIAGLERYFLINIDHHPGNTQFGAINWFDGSAAACGEMVFDVVRALRAPFTLEVATHIYVAILTDTGSFHYSSISPRSFEICKQALEAGVDPVAVSRTLFDSNTLGRLRLMAAVLSTVELDDSGRVAAAYLDEEMAHKAGATFEDTEGLINVPLTVKEIVAVIFFKRVEQDQYRISLRSKGQVDIGQVAKSFGGGGHKNAAGCTVSGPFAELRPLLMTRVLDAVAQDEAVAATSTRHSG